MFLQQVADLLIKFLLPESELAMPSVRKLLRGHLMTALLASVDAVCDPDTLNQFIVAKCSESKVPTVKPADSSFLAAGFGLRCTIVIVSL